MTTLKQSVESKETTAHRYLQRLALLLFLSLSCSQGMGQEKGDSDSTQESQTYTKDAKIREKEAQLDTVQSDVVRLDLLVDYAQYLSSANRDSAAMLIADSASRMAERLDSFEGRLLVNGAYGHLYLRQGELEKSLFYQRAKLVMLKELEEVDSLELGILYTTIAQAQMLKGLYYNALDTLHISIEILRRQDHDRLYAYCIGELSDLYIKLSKPDDGQPYLDEAIEILRTSEPNVSLPILLNNKARWLYKNDRFEEARERVEEADSYCRKHGFDDSYGYFRMREGQIAFAEEKYSEAIPLFQEAIEIFEVATDTIWILENSFNLSEAYLMQGDIDQAHKWGLQVQAYLYKMQNEGFRALAYMHLAEVYEAKGDLEQSLQYMHKHVVADVAADSIAKAKEALNLEARFKNGQQKISLLEKDKELLLQADEIVRKSNKLRLLGFGALGLTLLSALIVIVYRQRIKSQAQTAEIELNQALIESTEEERERIARELHDGTGSLLTGIKLGLEHLQEKTIDNEQAQQLSTTIYQVQSVAKEVRRVSHAMAPTAIERLPFEEVVTDLINAFSQIGKAEIDYSASGDFERMNKTERLMLYRIMQECLNNSFKHADASEITISLLATEGEIEMLYQDDGKGYDPGSTANGLGLTNIDKRIHYLHGKRTMETQSGSGMLLILNFPILRA